MHAARPRSSLARRTCRKSTGALGRLHQLHFNWRIGGPVLTGVGYTSADPAAVSYAFLWKAACTCYRSDFAAGEPMASKRDITRGIGWANGLALGIVIGSSVGMLRDNFVLGMGIAIGVGAALGVVLSRRPEPEKRVLERPIEVPRGASASSRFKRRY